MMTGQTGIGNTFIGPFNNYGNAEISGQFFVTEGLSLVPSVPQPTCTQTYRGTFWYTQSPSGTADHLQVCSKSASDTYSWLTVF